MSDLDERRDAAPIALLGLLLAACTARNPAYCGDHACVDPERPYCDYFGDVAGSPQTCIAVSCEPASFATCRGAVAVTCNEDGNNYVETECALGCMPAAGGCQECADNTHCNETQICETTTGQCRGCALDDDCPSRVCDPDTHACVPLDRIVYAEPGGAGGPAATCTIAQPCSLARAIGALTNSPTTPPTLRLLPGTYVTPIELMLSSAPITIVATGATIVVSGETPAVAVEGGANVTIRGLASTSEHNVRCGMASTTASTSAVTIRDATFVTANSGVAVELQRCTVNLQHVTMTGGSITVAGVHSDATWIADRLNVAAAGPSSIIAANAERFHVDVTNSRFYQTDLVLFIADTGPPGTSIRFAHSTFYMFDGLEMCKGAPPPSYIKLAIENSIVTAGAGYDALKQATPNTCVLTGTILSRQSNVLPGATVADPQFVDFATFDFHLKPTSPAIDTAVAGSATIDHDLDGRTRPHGARPDVGAYEYAP